MVVALDLPGHGRSDKPKETDAYGLQMVEDVILLLDHLKIRKAHMVGYSLGGMIVMKLMARYPDRVLSGAVGGMGWFREGSASQKLWENMSPREGNRTPPACVQSVGKLAVTREELSKIDIPVKVLVGSRDPVQRLYVAPLQRVRKDWSVIEIEDAGHLNIITKQQFRDEIAGWVKMNSSYKF
jgi:pimeloyl-ACP methyl ester carboxylesterase